MKGKLINAHHAQNQPQATEPVQCVLGCHLLQQTSGAKLTALHFSRMTHEYANTVCENWAVYCHAFGGGGGRRLSIQKPSMFT